MTGASMLSKPSRPLAEARNSDMDALLPTAARIGELLKTRRECIAVAESSSGGLVSAALLSIPGASAYFRAGAVVYTQQAREGLLAITPDDRAGMRSSSEPYALLLARTVRKRFGAQWGLTETGAAGPRWDLYGDSPGPTCIVPSG